MSCLMSSDWQNIRAQLLIIDALFSDYLGVSKPCTGRSRQDNESKAHHPPDDLPNPMPVQETSLDVSGKFLAEWNHIAMCGL